MIKPLTSLRFVFALMVFFSHLNLTTEPPGSLLRYLNDFAFHEGFIGVGFFFILSGFILAYTYNSKFKRGHVSKRDFYVARFARIYPLHIVTLLLALPIYLVSVHYSFWVPLFAHLSLTQSFIPIRDIYLSFNDPSWSISDEAFFYLCFPAAVTLISTKSCQAAIVIAALLIPLFIFLCPDHLQHWLFYISPFTRLIDFCLGILVYKVYKWLKKQREISFERGTMLELVSLAVLGTLFAFHDHVPLAYRFSCYYWPGMIPLIFAFSFQKGMFSRLISFRWCIVLGEISFAFYLIHYTVIRAYSFLPPRFASISALQKVGIMFAVTLVLSFVAHFYIEVPMNRWIRHRFGSKSKVRHSARPVV